MASSLPHPILFVDEIFKIIGLGNIPTHVAYTWTAMAILIVVGILTTRRLKLNPGPLQNFFEVVVGGLEKFIVQTVGDKGRKMVGFLIPLFLFILVANFLGLIPGFDAPTNNINTNAAMAITVFILYNFLGIKTWGFGYIKQFLGPVWWISPLMLPVELLSHLVRPVSLTLRLLGNIYGEEVVLAILFLLVPIAGTFPMYFLFTLADFIQAFVFFMLAMIYLKGALEEAH